MQRFSLVLFFWLSVCAMPACAESIRVAVASNFYSTLKLLSESFEQSTDHQIELIVGSSGKLASQIIQGAPYDLFFSADAERPKQLEEFNVAVEGSRTTYAFGRLVLVHRGSIANIYRKSVNHHESLLGRFLLDKNGRIASANPQLAPYGRATRQSLSAMKLDADSRLVYGENVSQTFHFLKTGNVDWAFVAMSQALDNGINQSNFFLISPQNYEPIDQQMLLLNKGAAANEFYEYILSPASQLLVSQSGYDAVIDISE